MTKTLDDALNASGPIQYGTYLGALSYVSIQEGPSEGMKSFFVNGIVTPSEIRRIADNLDPQPDNVAAIRAEARREALEEAAKAAENAYVVVEKTEHGEIRRSVGGTAAADIRALIEKEPTA